MLKEYNVMSKRSYKDQQRVSSRTLMLGEEDSNLHSWIQSPLSCQLDDPPKITNIKISSKVKLVKREPFLYNLNKIAQRRYAMLSSIPFDLDRIDEEDLDRQILRIAIMAELDAINLYEQLAALTEDEGLRAILLDVAREEKTHVGEFMALLLRKDEEQVEELEEGREEVEELLGVEEEES